MHSILTTVVRVQYINTQPISAFCAVVATVNDDETVDLLP